MKLYVVSSGYGFDSAWSTQGLAESRLAFLKGWQPTIAYRVKKTKVDPDLRREGQP